MPNTTYSTSISIAALTGVAARRVGVAIGISFVVMAFVPKVLALVLAVPDAVVAAYAIVLLALLFVVGMRMVVEDATDYRRSAGFSFWIGVGFQGGQIFPEYLSGFAGGFFENGMTTGGLTAITLTLFTEVTGSRRRRFHSELAVSELPRIRKFLSDFAKRHDWDAAMLQRLDAVAEETLLTLLDTEESADGLNEDIRRTLRLTASRQEGRAVLEFVAASTSSVEDSGRSVDKRAARCLSLLQPQARRTSKIGSRCSPLKPQDCRSSETSRCGCCNITLRRSFISSTTISIL